MHGRLRMVHRAIGIVLVMMQCFPFSVLAANTPNSIRWVSINKTGHWSSSHEAIYPELIRRVQKWVENIDSLDVQVALSSKSINKRNLGLDKLRLNLSESSEKLRKALLAGEGSNSLKTLLSEMKELRQTASSKSELGPEIQTSLISEAAYYWSQNDLPSTRTAVERAIKIQPKGQVPLIEEWDDSNAIGFNSEAFEGFVSKVKASQVRSCIISIETKTSPSIIKVNGFSIGNSKEVALVPGNLHHIEIQSPGYESGKENVVCSGAGRKKVKVVLQKSKDPSTITETDLDKNHQSKSMILIEPVQDRFKLFLYTPGRDFDEILLSHPLRLADMESDSGLPTGPIVTDAALAIFEKHKLLATHLQVGVLGNPDFSRSLSSDIDEGSRKKRWLNSPIFWGIVGGALLGGAITYFSTQNKNPSAVNSDWE